MYASLYKHRWASTAGRCASESVVDNEPYFASASMLRRYGFKKESCASVETTNGALVPHSLSRELSEWGAKAPLDWSREEVRGST